LQLVADLTARVIDYVFASLIAGLVGRALASPLRQGY